MVENVSRPTCGHGSLAPVPCASPAEFVASVDRSEDYSDGSFLVRTATTYRCAAHVDRARRYALRITRI